MNALSINIPANFAADCNNTLKRYNAAQTDAERRAVLDRQTVQGRTLRPYREFFTVGSGISALLANWVKLKQARAIASSIFLRLSFILFTSFLVNHRVYTDSIYQPSGFVNNKIKPFALQLVLFVVF